VIKNGFPKFGRLTQMIELIEMSELVNKKDQRRKKRTQNGYPGSRTALLLEPFRFDAVYKSHYHKFFVLLIL